MKTIVCLKAVPKAIANLQIADAGDRIDCQSNQMFLNESDEYALEAALAIKMLLGGEVIAVTLGKLPAQRALQTGLAKGVDRAVRVDDQIRNAEATSAALAAAIKKIGYDLILTGVESSDSLGGEVGIRIAAKLKIPCAYAVVGVEPEDGLGKLKVTKEIGGGMKQVLEMSLPSLLCIQQGILPLSFVPLKNMLQAQTRPIERISPDTLDIPKQPGKLRVIQVGRPVETHRATMIDGEPAELAHKLYDIIRSFSQ